MLMALTQESRAAAMLFHAAQNSASPTLASRSCCSRLWRPLACFASENGPPWRKIAAVSWAYPLVPALFLIARAALLIFHNSTASARVILRTSDRGLRRTCVLLEFSVSPFASCILM